MVEQYSIRINGEDYPIVIRKHASSRRMTIRYQPLKRSLSLTLPRRASLRQGLRFVEERREWIARQVQAQPDIALADGQLIPVLGQEYRLSHSGRIRGVITLEDNVIQVSGDPASMARRVRDWLRQQLKHEIERLAREKAARIGKTIHAIGLRDTSSRWGSCSSDGNLSFSWRLVFAPYAVLDYLVAHEVAHLKEMNHSPAFWKVVESLCPDWQKQRRWLRVHGRELYAYG